MKKFTLVFIILGAITSCKNGSTVKEENKSEFQFIKVVKDFYTWYIHENYTKPSGLSSRPKVISNSDSTLQLDVDGYIKKLRAAGFFTDDFVKREEKLAITCNNAMLSNKWDGESEADFEGCELTLYDRWVGGQGEDINGFKIGNIIIDPRTKTYSVETEILIDESKFTTAIVSLKQIDEGNYKIDNISLRFD